MARGFFVVSLRRAFRGSAASEWVSDGVLDVGAALLTPIAQDTSE